ncbi:MAG TPA: heparinase II/III family protein, partial [Terriglobales bacterium]|nr:heparinase II/III family protein [Terriglobales bacterium]
MGQNELLDRTRQHLQARIDAYRSRKGFDFTEELIGAGSGPQGRFFFEESDLPEICRLLKGRMPASAAQIVASAEKACRHSFDLLGFTDLDYGSDINWHLDIVHGKEAARVPWFKIGYLDFAQVGDAKITWELNRHQHLVTLAKAYRLTGCQEFAEEAVRQWRHWQRENPYPIGINWASSLEVAFRSLSWIWTLFLLQSSPVMTPELRQAWTRALALNGRHIDTYLSTYFSPNTHLLGEGMVLFFLGTLLPGLKPAARWKGRGWNVVLEAARDQVRNDGFYFEQSTYYHVYALDFFLHARVLAAANQVAVPAEYDAVLVRMLDALLLSGRAGIVPQVGDDDGGRLFDGRRNQAGDLLDPLSTGAVLFQRGDFKFLCGGMREETLWLLGPSGLRA